jgi:hypothetical protein
MTRVKRTASVLGVVAVVGVGLVTWVVTSSQVPPSVGETLFKRDVRSMRAITRPSMLPVQSVSNLMQAGAGDKMSPETVRARLRRFVRRGLTSLPAGRRHLFALQLSSVDARRMRDVQATFLGDLEAAFRRVYPTLAPNGSFRIVRFSTEVNRAQSAFKTKFGHLTYTQAEREALHQIAAGS